MAEELLINLKATFAGVYDFFIQFADQYQSDGSHVQEAIKEGLQRYKCHILKHATLPDKTFEVEKCRDKHLALPFKQARVRKMSVETFIKRITSKGLTDVFDDFIAMYKDGHSVKCAGNSVLLMKLGIEEDENTHTLFVCIEAYLLKLIENILNIGIHIKVECQDTLYAAVTAAAIPGDLVNIRKMIGALDRFAANFYTSLAREFIPIASLLSDPSYTSADYVKTVMKELQQKVEETQGGFTRTNLHKSAYNSYATYVEYCLDIFCTIKTEYKSLGKMFNINRPITTLLMAPINIIRIASRTCFVSAYAAITIPIKLSLMIPLIPQLTHSPKKFFKTLLS